VLGGPQKTVLSCGAYSAQRQQRWCDRRLPHSASGFARTRRYIGFGQVAHLKDTMGSDSKDSKKPNRLSKPEGKSDLGVVAPIALKYAAEATGIPGLGPATSALVDSIQARIERTGQAMRQETEERLLDFYTRLLGADAAMNEDVARAMVDDKDFHALLRACVADIEAEKVGAYAQLARGIASGAIPKEWRRHFILSLRDLAADDLERLRGALIAKENHLIPAQGPSMGQDHFLKPDAPGTARAISIGALAARGFAQEGKLLEAGENFARACLRPDQLTPSSIGYRAWSGHNAAILNYQMGKSRELDALADKLQDALRAHAVKSTVVAVVRTNEQQARLVFTMGILLLGERTEGLESNLPHLASFAAKVPTMLVDAVGQAGDLPGLPLFGRVMGAGKSPGEIIEAILEMTAAEMRKVAAARFRRESSGCANA